MVAVLALFLCLCAGQNLAGALPVVSSGVKHSSSVSSQIVPVKEHHTGPVGRGSQIFASAQWERDLPSTVRVARNPQPTVFRGSDVVNAAPAPKSVPSIFANAQWEARQSEQVVSSDSEEHECDCGNGGEQQQQK
ncbi:hypothetical protein R3P38DRAFT_52582 [Favolaschia claudopus]|uniref:Secreted protein n=1 Tax=Favolaschia claudopus TaxID=2862362 RepID=A0AAW0EKE1_9AGAR